MQFQSIYRVKFVMLPLLALTIGFGVGCGGDDDAGGPEPVPECAISAVNTGLDDSWQTGIAGRGRLVKLLPQAPEPEFLLEAELGGLP